MADQTAMAKANARGATPSEVARGNQVANALGVDLKRVSRYRQLVALRLTNS